jgi:agmatine/peptidylarginine deiminase
MKRNKIKTKDKQLWIARVVLAILIAATIGALIYLYVTRDSSLDRKTETPAKVDPNSEKAKRQKVAALIKDSYEAYLKTAYEQEKPDRKKALKEFKTHMTPEGADLLGEAKKDKDPVLCSERKPEALSYTTPSISNNAAIVAVVAEIKSGAATALITVNVPETKIVSVSCGA